MSDVIEKTIVLKASPERVWRALSDAREFGQWFGVAMEAPFVAGEVARGRLTVPSCGQKAGDSSKRIMEVMVVSIEPPSRFAFTWRPFAIDPDVDYSNETPTLVEFHLEAAGQGTRLTVRESGFDKVPAHRRDEAFRMNTRGWGAQLENILAHVDG